MWPLSCFLYCFCQTYSEIVSLAGIPTDEEQATGLEKIIMKAMKEGSVRSFISEQKRVTVYVCMYSKN